jgi:hypothetical protein
MFTFLNPYLTYLKLGIVGAVLLFGLYEYNSYENTIKENIKLRQDIIVQKQINDDLLVEQVRKDRDNNLTISIMQSQLQHSTEVSAKVNTVIKTIENTSTIYVETPRSRTNENKTTIIL